MNESRFAQELASLLTDYIDSKYECDQKFFQEENDLSDCCLPPKPKKKQNIKEGIIDLLNNPIFDIELDELHREADKCKYLRSLYLNINALYEGLQALMQLDPE